MADPKPLTGKVAIVTGAGRNIGRAIAMALAAEGACVTVNARSNRAEAEAVVAAIGAAGGKGLTALGDVAEPATADRLAAETAARFGRIDILVNNAAIRREATFETLDLAAWREVMATTLDASFLMAKAERPYRRQGPRPRRHRKGRSHRPDAGAGP